MRSSRRKTVATETTFLVKAGPGSAPKITVEHVWRQHRALFYHGRSGSHSGTLLFSPCPRSPHDVRLLALLQRNSGIGGCLDPMNRIPQGAFEIMTGLFREKHNGGSGGGGLSGGINGPWCGVRNAVVKRASDVVGETRVTAGVADV
ncbi:predicted protein [Chaetomium globosum CBS 148.51]|uniref:Uncharacterized protein n=1 Tax=Chaetomium globosum (strain ATCC 6205 / CBS 148.51 / DSM 1962 / NBRC 6347 / NRRL 1970) TaxID=306901 RepID=Q2H672_CHAGB|nr:uncharacterized protein CHGG_05843 [Chaetomium globosum CBS 148.51]EAQ89224.1 predicted protein [Chaetomium globosum CBS 148.51]